MPRLCVRGARGRCGRFGPVPGVVFLLFPPSCPACSALRVAGRPVRVSFTLARRYAIPRGLCLPRARSGCPSGSPRVTFTCVCALALPRRSLPPLLGGVARAPRAVPALGAGRAVPRGPCPSACPAPVPCSVWHAWGGAVRSRFPPTWLGVVGVAAGRPRGRCHLLLRGASEVRRSPSPDCPPTGRALGVRYPRVVGAGVRVWGPFSVPLACTPCGGCAPQGRSVAFVCRGAGWEGGGRAPYPPFVRPGGPVGRGVALPRSIPLPSLGRQQSGCYWCRAVHGGRGPPYHSGSCSPAFPGRDVCGVLARWRGLACSPRPLWEPAAGAGGRVALRLRSRAGGGTIPPASGGGCRGPRGLRAGGGPGGGARRGLPAPLLGSGLRYSVLAPPRVVGALPSGVCVRSGWRCRPGVGGGEGRPVDRSPGGPCRPETPPPPSLCELRSREGHVGRGLHTVPVCRRAPPPSLVRALLRHAGVGSPCGRDPRGSRLRGALGRAVCRSSRIPPPRVVVPSGGGGASPRLRGGGGPLL